MRTTLATALAISIMTAASTAWAQAPAPAKCDNPNALGVARTVQIDTTGGPGFGFEHFKAYDFLQDHEVVLTFDDGPWPANTEKVLKALADQCTKAIFFTIGKHASWAPAILKKVAAGGHTIGTHTWSHKDLTPTSAEGGKASRKDATPMTFEEGKAEIEKGIAAVSISLGNKPVDPFFRFPALKHPPELMKYLAARNVAVFSTDMDSFDFKMRKPEQVVDSVMKRLAKNGKGIVLMHDFQHATADAAPELLKRLKAGGFKVVQVVGKTQIEPIKEYTDAVLKEMGAGMEDARPMSSVIQTIGGNNN